MEIQVLFTADPQRLYRLYKEGDKVFVCKSHVKVRYVETDRMGIVHHSNYASYFEIGRTDFIAQLGRDYRSIEEEGVMLPLTDLNCHFYVGAKYDDELLIETRLTKLSVVRCTYSYAVYLKATNQKLCEGSTTHGFVGSDFHPINLKKKFPHIYKLLYDNLSE